MKTSRAISFFALLIMLTSSLHAQPYCPRPERGDPLSRRRTDIDTNNVRTTVNNFGILGRTGGQGIPFEWPRNSGRMYLALSATFVGGEVVGPTGDTIRIVDMPSYRTNPATGNSWNFEPVPQYLRSTSSEIARSDDPASWPSIWPDKMNDPTDPGWPGSWNGILGKNQFTNGTEVYYHYSDDRYNRHRFYPDSADTNRRGLGIIVSERVLEFRGLFLDDAIIVVTEINNVGTRPISKAGITLWIPDFVGGDGDSYDDFPGYDLARRIVQCNDRDGYSSSPAFIGARVGTPTLVFAQSPNNIGISNIQYIPAGAINFNQAPDSFYWNTFMRPGSYVDPSLIGAGEFDLFVSHSYFPLPVCTPQRLTYAWVFGSDSLDGKRKAEYVRSFINGGYRMNTVQVGISSPTVGSTVSGNIPIQWTTIPNRQSLRVDLYASTDFGDTWKAIAVNEQNDGSYNWNTLVSPDGIFNKLRIVAYDSLGIGHTTMDTTFTINNPQQPAAPQIRLDRTLSGGVYQGALPVRWIAGDADGELFSIDLSYGLTLSQSTTYSIATGLPNSGAYSWNTELARNSKSVFLRARAYNALSSRDSLSQPFEIRNPRYGLSDTAFSHRQTVGTGMLRSVIFNPSQVTGHAYKVQFDSVAGTNRRKLDLYDETTGTLLRSAEYLNARFAPWEIVSADGFAIQMGNDSTMVDTSRTKWNNTDIKRTYFELWHEGDFGFPEPADYIIEIGNVGIGRSDSAYLSWIEFPPKDVNFRIWNTTTQMLTHFAFLEQDGNDGRLTAGVMSDVIALLKWDATSGWVPTWEVYLMRESSMRNPAPGDTFVARLFKSFQPGDFYRFTAVTGNLLTVKRNDGPTTFSLGQNYPNPFNPITTIRFTIPVGTGHVPSLLKVYDVLGREVATLVNEEKEPGTYTVQWNAAGFASGVYFYQLKSGSSIISKKLVYLK